MECSPLFINTADSQNSKTLLQLDTEWPSVNGIKEEIYIKCRQMSHTMVSETDVTERGKNWKKRVECQMSKVNSGMSAAELLLPLSCTLTDRLKAVKWNSNTDCVLSKLSHSIWEKTLNCDFFCPFFHLSIRLSFYPSIDLSVSSLMH